MIKAIPQYFQPVSGSVIDDESNFRSGCQSDVLIQSSKSSLKAAVFTAQVGGNCLVIKDYSASHPIIRATICKWLVRHEMQALRRLSDHPWVPRLIGKYGRFGFALEMVQGQVLNNRILNKDPGIMRNIDQQIKKMHDLGVTHNDIRMRNLILGTHKQLYIIDFASAVIKPAYFSPLSTVLFYITRFSDRVKLVKLKQQYNADLLHGEDLRLLKFVGASTLLGKVWKKYIYRCLKFIVRNRQGRTS